MWLFDHEIQIPGRDKAYFVCCAFKLGREELSIVRLSRFHRKNCRRISRWIFARGLDVGLKARDDGFVDGPELEIERF